MTDYDHEADQEIEDADNYDADQLDTDLRAGGYTGTTPGQSAGTVHEAAELGRYHRFASPVIDISISQEPAGHHDSDSVTIRVAMSVPAGEADFYKGRIEGMARQAIESHRLSPEEFEGMLAATTNPTREAIARAREDFEALSIGEAWSAYPSDLISRLVADAKAKEDGE